MVQETIQAVKEAEQKADEMIRNASEQGRVLVEEAKLKAEAKKNETKKAVKGREQKAESNFVKEGEQILNKALEEAKQEAISLQETAKKRTKEAVSLIISELV